MCDKNKADILTESASGDVYLKQMQKLVPAKIYGTVYCFILLSILSVFLRKIETFGLKT